MYQIKLIQPNDALDIMRRDKNYLTTDTKPKNKKMLLLCGLGAKVGWNDGDWGFLNKDCSRAANGKIFSLAEIVVSKRLNNKEVRTICQNNGISKVTVNFDGHKVNLSLEDLSSKTHTWVNVIKADIFPYHEFITKETELLQPEDGELKLADGEIVRWVS